MRISDSCKHLHISKCDVKPCEYRYDSLLSVAAASTSDVEQLIESLGMKPGHAGILRKAFSERPKQDALFAAIKASFGSRDNNPMEA